MYLSPADPPPTADDAEPLFIAAANPDSNTVICALYGFFPEITTIYTFFLILYVTNDIFLFILQTL